MMGLANWIHWCAWFTKNLLFLLVSISIATILLKVTDTEINKTGLPQSGKSQGKIDFIQGQEKVREFCISSGNF